MQKDKKLETNLWLSKSSEHTEKQETISNGIQYKGIINVKVKKGNKIITKKTFHNKGTKYLFEYLCNCLTNDTPDINKAPVAVRLYCNTGTAQDDYNAAIDENSEALTEYIYYARREVTTENNIYYAHLEFTISCSYVKSPSGGNYVDINQVGLYSAANADSTGSDANKEKYSAVFNFIENNDWDPITVHAQSGDYQIFIDWILSFGNPGGLI